MSSLMPRAANDKLVDEKNPAILRYVVDSRNAGIKNSVAILSICELY